MVNIYPNYGHTLTMVFFKQYYIKSLHKQAKYGEINQQLSLFSHKPPLRYACCEKCLYITMVTIYPNYGHTLTMVFFKPYENKSLHKQAKYCEINQQLSSFSLKLRTCLLQEVLIYHNGYHIPKLWAYVNHGIF